MESISNLFDGLEIQNQSIATRAANIIRKKIICGELPPRQHLKEVTFSEALGVSKACIREAFIVLAREGLVVRVANKYTQVVSFNKHDVHELFSLRSTLEQLSACTCAQYDTVPEEKMRECIRRMKALIVNDSTTRYEEFADEDMNFHESIIVAAGNQRVLQIWKDLRSQIQMLFFSQLKNYPYSVKYHYEFSHDHILNSMLSGDVENAGKVIKTHVEAALERTLQDPLLDD